MSSSHGVFFTSNIDRSAHVLSNSTPSSNLWLHTPKNHWFHTPKNHWSDHPYPDSHSRSHHPAHPHPLLVDIDTTICAGRATKSSSTTAHQALTTKI